MDKYTLRALTTTNGYKFYMYDDHYVYFHSKRINGYADIRMTIASCLDEQERLQRMRMDLTES